MNEDDERSELQTRRVALKKRHAELEREMQRLHGSHDRGALHTLQEQIKDYEEDLKMFNERLGEFHALFGPLGPEAKDES